MMKQDEAKTDIAKRLQDIADLYKVDQPVEGFKRLTTLFIDLAAAYTCCLSEEEGEAFVAGLATVILLDVTTTVKQMKRMMKKESPIKPQMVIRMNAEYKS